MGFDVGTAIEVAIGLSFLFFLLSLIVSAVTETIAWVLKWRAVTLEKGIKGMFGDGGLATELLEHPLVQTDLTKSSNKKRPSYLSPRNFSAALIDILAKRSTTAAAGVRLEEVKSGAAQIGSCAPKLGEQLQALEEGSDAQSLASYRKGLEEWFDDAMDRVSGWYKRWAQLITIGIALLVAVGMKADAVTVAEYLANEPTVRAVVVAKAEETAKEEEDAASAGKSISDSVKDVTALKLPLLWDKDNDDVDWSVIVGLLITTIAISLGAPFWFDTLNKLAHLRTTGKKPEPEK
jgi:hypothetical protein